MILINAKNWEPLLSDIQVELNIKQWVNEWESRTELDIQIWESSVVAVNIKCGPSLRTTVQNEKRGPNSGPGATISSSIEFYITFCFFYRGHIFLNQNVSLMKIFKTAKEKQCNKVKSWGRGRVKTKVTFWMRPTKACWGRALIYII